MVGHQPILKDNAFGELDRSQRWISEVSLFFFPSSNHQTIEAGKDATVHNFVKSFLLSVIVCLVRGVNGRDFGRAGIKERETGQQVALS